MNRIILSTATHKNLPLILLSTLAVACAPEGRDSMDMSDGARARGEAICKYCDSPSNAGGNVLPDLEGDWEASAENEGGRMGSLRFQIPEKVYPSGRFDISLDLLDEDDLYYVFDGAGTVSASGKVTMTGDLWVTLPDGEELSARGATVIHADYSSDDDILEGTMNLGGDDIWGLSGDDIWGLSGDDLWGFRATR